MAKNDNMAKQKINGKNGLKWYVILIVVILLSFLAIKFLAPENVKKNVFNLQKQTQHQMGAVGEINKSNFDPEEYLTTWNFNNLDPEERAKYYKETIIPNSNGAVLREYYIYAEDHEIEVAPGVFFPAWAYNGQVPGPTIRATEGDKIKIVFENKGSKPHSMHFHGFHESEMDGAMPDQMVLPGEKFTYEFNAEPYGLHLYHCHSLPLKQHISQGLYGAYIVDPKQDTRTKADKEFVMMMNGFDTDFDGENDIYAVNTAAFYYVKNPIKVKKDELVRIYLINILESDLINSFHLHANFFDKYPTGTKMEPEDFTDIIILGQGERSILDTRFKYPGKYMIHAHVTEFSELGWMATFEVEGKNSTGSMIKNQDKDINNVNVKNTNKMK